MLGLDEADLIELDDSDNDLNSKLTKLHAIVLHG